MNKYNKKRSREIKQLMKADRSGSPTYKQARRAWSWARRFAWCSPCEDCDRPFCKRFKQGSLPMVYCPDRR